MSVQDAMVSKETFHIEVCGQCSHRFTNPRVEENEIGPYYDSPDYISHTNDDVSFFGKVYQSLRKVNLNRKQQLVQRTVNKDTFSLLDYGCGTGQFLEHMSLARHQVQGMEINEGARSQAQKFGKVYDQLQSIEGQYDVITMWHVMEHVYDLEELMQKFNQLLQSGGALIVAVPNCESPDARHYRSNWAAWDVPIHIHHFTKQSMSKVATRFGYELESIAPMKLDSYYISLLSEQFKANRSNRTIGDWLRGFWHGWLSNMTSGNQNTSSLIYVLRKT